jgi:hypothetical protein
VNLITFFLFGEAMVMFAFFLTTFIRHARIAILVGIFMFVIGLLFESFVFSGGFIGYIWWSPELVSPAGWQILVRVGWVCKRVLEYSHDQMPYAFAHK